MFNGSRELPDEDFERLTGVDIGHNWKLGKKCGVSVVRKVLQLELLHLEQITNKVLHIE